MNEIVISHSAFFLVIMAGLSVGATIGAVVAGICAASKRESGCVCREAPAPEIAVENAFVLPGKPPQIYLSVKFHTDRRWLLTFNESDAVQVAHDFVAVAADREAQREAECCPQGHDLLAGDGSP